MCMQNWILQIAPDKDRLSEASEGEYEIEDIARLKAKEYLQKLHVRFFLSLFVLCHFFKLSQWTHFFDGTRYFEVWSDFFVILIRKAVKLRRK